jgi:hypothetical protein
MDKERRKQCLIKRKEAGKRMNERKKELKDMLVREKQDLDFQVRA